MTTLEKRYHQHEGRLAAHGQSHLLAYWPDLGPIERAQLLDDLDQIDLGRCAPLIEPYVRNRPMIGIPARLDPPPVLPAVPDAAHRELYRRALETGVGAVRRGEVAAFTVAGGQGTRLGYDGPKGGFRVSPIRSASLFQLFAESLLGTERRHGRRPRWYIMTSPGNHAQTIELFESAGHYGLDPAGVMFLPQGQMPSFTADGKIALAERHRVALSPDGHGGSLRALCDSGALDEMRRHGVQYISYFQVDNPLVKVIDPLFLGLHILKESEMSSKAAAKANDFERVGNFCVADGKLTVIEYTDLPDELATARNADGSRRFDAGNLAIHILNVSFVERLTRAGAVQQLPWHRADKRVAIVGPDGRLTEPASPNVAKLEMFIFDALPLAANPLLLYALREEEFSPVKNADGVDSPATARRDLGRRAVRWLEHCGCNVPQDATGKPDLPIEISPFFALDADDLRERLTEPPAIRRGQPLLLI